MDVVRWFFDILSSGSNMVKRSVLLSILCVVFALLYLPAAAQSNLYDIGALTVELPPDWIGKSDPLGLLFGADEASITYITAYMQSIYAALSGSEATSPDQPEAPESYAGGYVFVIDRRTASDFQLGIKQLASQFPAATPMTVDGRSALYLPNPDIDPNEKQLELIGLIENELQTILIVVNGTKDLTSEEQFVSMLNSIRFAVVAEPTAKPATDAQPAAPGSFSTAVLTATESMKDYPASRLWVVSPDASRLAYTGQDGICVVTFAESGGAGEPACAVITSDRPFTPRMLSWSPDSRYVAFHEDSFVTLVDSDIWVLDVEAGQILNLTPDGYEGSFFPFSKISERGLSSLGVDITPVWSGDMLYFFRTEMTEAPPTVTALYRVNVADGSEAEFVAELSSDRDESFGVFDMPESHQLNGAASVSPSGRWLAALMRPRNLENARVVLFDLESGTVQRMAQIDSFYAGLPAFATTGQQMMFSGIDWLPDESGLVIGVGAYGAAPGIGNLYQYDLNTGVVQPLLDLSAIGSQDELLSTPDFLLLLPNAAQVLPDRSGLIWAGRFQGAVQLWSVPLPLTGAAYTPDALPEKSGGADNAPPSPSYASLGEKDGLIRFLVGMSLLTLERIE